MGVKSKDKKTNSRQHRKDVRKDIKKRAKKVSRANREAVGDISYGSRVVQRTRADVSRAPAYKPEKIKSGGYHSTFPSLQGVLDNQMNQMAIVENAFRKQKAASAWTSMWNQGLNGELDEIPEETKKQLMEVQRGIEKQHNKEKALAELSSKKKQLDTLTNKNIASAEGHAKELIRNKEGKKKVAGKKAIRNLIDKIEIDTEKENKKQKDLQKLNEVEERNREAKRKVEVAKQTAKEKYKDDPDVMKIIDDPEELLQEMMRRDKMVADFNDQVKMYEKFIQRQKDYADKERRLQIYYNELTAKTGWEDPKIAGEIADIFRSHGNQEIIRARIDEYLKAQEAAQENMTNMLDEYRTHMKKLNANYDYYGAQMTMMRDNLRFFLENSPHVDKGFKRQIERKKTKELLDKALTIQEYLPVEITNQVHDMREKYTKISKYISILHKNKVEFTAPAAEWVKKLKDIAEMEVPEYMERALEHMAPVVQDEDEVHKWDDVEVPTIDESDIGENFRKFSSQFN